MLKRWKILVLSGLVILTIIMPACRNSDEDIQPVTVPVKRGDLVLKVSADGNLALVTERKLAFETGGKVTEVTIEEGAAVTKGQVLARLDTTAIDRAMKTAQLGIEAADITLQAAQLDLKQAGDAVKAAEIDYELAKNAYDKIITPNPYNTYRFVVPEAVDSIRVANSRVKEAEVEFQKAVKGEPYDRKLIEDYLAEVEKTLGEVAQKLGWGIEAGTRPAYADYWTMRNLELQIEKARTGMENASGLVSKAALGINRAQNDAARARNEMERAKEELPKTVLASPVDGIAARVNVKAGDMVTPGNLASPAFLLIDPDKLELSIRFDEIDIPNIEVGDKVSITLDALPDLALEGSVTSISLLPEVETGLVSYRVKTGLTAPRGNILKPGMSASAELVYQSRQNILLVPARALRKDAEGKPFVEVVVGGKAMEQAVVTGLSDGFLTEVASGLSEGDIIVESWPKNQSGLFGG